MEFTFRAFKTGAIQIYGFDGKNQFGKIKVIDLKEPSAYIPHLNVRKRYRKRGYGTALLIEIESLCKQNGCSAMSLYVSITNEPAINLYKKFGFFIALTTFKKERHYLMVKKF